MTGYASPNHFETQAVWTDLIKTNIWHAVRLYVLRPPPELAEDALLRLN